MRHIKLVVCQRCFGRCRAASRRAYSSEPTPQLTPDRPLATKKPDDKPDMTYPELHPSGLVQLPPPELRYRVHGARDAASFLETGQQTRRDLEGALSHIGHRFADYTNVLDFGCGSARTLLAFAENRPPTTRFYGTDIDTEVIKWGHDHLPYVTFTTNNRLPPLAFRDNTFDLIYAISVFTHLDENFQFQWLQELQRIAKPGAILLLTVHGEYHWQKFVPDLVPEIQEHGFVFQQAYSPDYLYPEWFQVTHHTETYVRNQWSKYFQILDYLPRGLNNHQDLVILKK